MIRIAISKIRPWAINEFRIQNRWGGRRIFWVASGEISVKDIADFRKKVMSDPHYRPDLNIILDYRKSQIRYSSTDSWQLSDGFKRDKPVQKIMVLAECSKPGSEIQTESRFSGI